MACRQPVTPGARSKRDGSASFANQRLSSSVESAIATSVARCSSSGRPTGWRRTSPRFSEGQLRTRSSSVRAGTCSYGHVSTGSEAAKLRITVAPPPMRTPCLSASFGAGEKFTDQFVLDHSLVRRGEPCVVWLEVCRLSTRFLERLEQVAHRFPGTEASRHGDILFLQWAGTS
jgi:hypothetical protein